MKAHGRKEEEKKKTFNIELNTTFESLFPKLVLKSYSGMMIKRIYNSLCMYTFEYLMVQQAKRKKGCHLAISISNSNINIFFIIFFILYLKAIKKEKV